MQTIYRERIDDYLFSIKINESNQIQMQLDHASGKDIEDTPENREITRGFFEEMAKSIEEKIIKVYPDFTVDKLVNHRFLKANCLTRGKS